jgi:hypothetical protein
MAFAERFCLARPLWRMSAKVKSDGSSQSYPPLDVRFASESDRIFAHRRNVAKGPGRVKN